MSWLQLRFDSDAEHSETLEQALVTVGAVAVTLQDNADQSLLEPGPGEQPIWQHTRVTGLFPADCELKTIRKALSEILGSELPRDHSEILEDKDWQREWERHYRPMRFGTRLWICPSWTPPPEPDAVNLLLDPGLAFGTGTHPTTALCLRWLDGQDLQDKTVVDYGCGSGILAIAALLLGAKQVIAVDHDPQALSSTQDNAKRNKIEPSKLSVLSPDQLAGELFADMLIANILAGPLIQLRETLMSLLKPNGHLVLSGLLTTQLTQLQEHYQSQVRFSPYEIEEDWVRLSGCKR